MNTTNDNAPENKNEYEFGSDIQLVNTNNPTVNEDGLAIPIPPVKNFKISNDTIYSIKPMPQVKLASQMEKILADFVKAIDGSYVIAGKYVVQAYSNGVTFFDHVKLDYQVHVLKGNFENKKVPVFVKCFSKNNSEGEEIGIVKINQATGGEVKSSKIFYVIEADKDVNLDEMDYGIFAIDLLSNDRTTLWDDKNMRVRLLEVGCSDHDYDPVLGTVELFRLPIEKEEGDQISKLKEVFMEKLEIQDAEVK